MKNVIFEALNTKTIWSREIAILKPKWHRLNVNLVTVYNTIIKNLQTAIRNNSPILYSDPEMKNILPEGSTNITYKRGKSLRELISPSMFPSRLSLILLYVNVNLKYVTSAKLFGLQEWIYWQLLAKHIKWEVSYVVLVLMWFTWSAARYVKSNRYVLHLRTILFLHSEYIRVIL